jgi:hypothetical protein
MIANHFLLTSLRQEHKEMVFHVYTSSILHNVLVCVGFLWPGKPYNCIHFTRDNWDQKCIGLSKRKDWLFRVKWLQELQKLITLPQVNQTIDYISPLCFDLANASIHEFPTITFHFIDASGNGTVHFVLAPENYISLYLEPFIYCLTILPGADFGLPVSIIGNLAQANHQMVFDRVNHQIGWASADCSKL